MKLSLLNTLSDGRGGGINPDGLSLDLQFAADKTFSKPSSLAAGETAITSRRGPSATFLRSTAATEVGPDGLIRYAPENLLLRSDDFGNATWTKVQLSVSTNTTTAPDGTITADSLIENTANAQRYVFQQITKSAASEDYLLSVYYKNAVGSRNLIVALTNGTTSGRGAIFTTNGTVSASNVSIGTGSGFVIKSSTVTSVGDGWYRASILVNTDTSTRLDAVVYLSQSSTSVLSYTGDGVSSIFLWGAQLERHSSARAYIPTTTAAVYGPRFDHDPVTLACKGLLIEEGRTNQILHSQNFANAAWQAIGTGATKIGASSLADPQGLSNAYEINVGTTGGSVPSNVRQIISPTLTTAQRTLSIYARTSTGTSVFRLQVWTGLIELSSQNLTATTNWTRFTFVINDALSEFKITAGSAGGSVSNIHVWGAQIEAGSFPTSYIPTTTGTLARSADVCNITGANFTSFYNQSEGTLFADVSGLMTGALAGNRGIAVITDGTYANKFEIVKSANVSSIRAEGRTGSVDQFILGNDYAPFTQYKVALGVKTNDTNAAFNGSLKTTDTSVTLPSTMNRLEFRDATAAAGGQPSCHLAAIRYYRKRLSNAKLQALTV